MKKTIREVEVGDFLVQVPWLERERQKMAQGLTGAILHFDMDPGVKRKARVMGVCGEVCFYALFGDAVARIATFTALVEEGWEFDDPDGGRAEEAIKTLEELGRIKDGKIIE